MTTAHHCGRGSKATFGLILIGLIAAQPALATISDPTAASTAMEPSAVPTINSTIPPDAAPAEQTVDPVFMPPSDIAPYDPFANSEQPVEIDPALVPPPVE